MSQAMQKLLAILDLEKLEHNLYRGRSHDVGWQRVFGGQVIGQALVAAQHTVAENRHVHSLHCYFMLPGDPSVPIIYNVDRLRDGGAFTTRRVTAIQHGHAIFSLECSFQVDEEGLEHQFPMPLNMPEPETLRSQFELLEMSGHPIPDSVRSFWARERPLEIRPVNTEHYTSSEKLPPHQSVWIRVRGEVPDDRRLQSAVLAYLSDMVLLDTSTYAHGRIGFEKDIQMASLDHAMWFHRTHKLNDWLLYTSDSPSTMGSRGFTRGFIYARDGTLVASTAQEGLVRLRRKRPQE